MSHIVNSDKGAKGRFPEVKDPTSRLASRRMFLRNQKKKKRESTLCFTPQELLVISDGAAERAPAIASAPHFMQGD